MFNTEILTYEFATKNWTRFALSQVVSLATKVLGFSAAFGLMILVLWVLAGLRLI